MKSTTPLKGTELGNGLESERKGSGGPNGVLFAATKRNNTTLGCTKQKSSEKISARMPLLALSIRFQDTNGPAKERSSSAQEDRDT